jgi:acylphosphatase
MTCKRLSITVTGRVQGVGYRYFARDVAESLGITGWVQNNYDRTVECEAQGDETALVAFCDKLREGPPLAYVADVFTVEMPVVNNEAEFSC